MDNDFFNDPEFQQLIKDYIVYLNGLVPEISAAIDTGDYASVTKIGHNIKGSGGGYGFSELTEIGQEIEFGGKASDVNRMKSGLKQLETFLASNP